MDAGSQKAHPWAFRARFRREAYGWRSALPIARIKEAVTEIKAVARNDPVLGAEGAILFLERVSPALEHVDSSSGAIGTAVNKAVDTLVPIIARAPVDLATSQAWLERLWDAYQNDMMPYIETLDDYWGELCGSPEVASAWADRFLWMARTAAGPDPAMRGHFRGAITVFSALMTAGRYEEILDLLQLPGYRAWSYRVYGVRALAALGRKAEALRFAEASRDRYTPESAMARECEAILLSCGLVDEAFRRYGAEASCRGTRVAWFRALAAKYPHKTPAELLAELVDSTPGEEGKWFAAAKDAGLFEEAIRLAQTSPCDPLTLSRAARDFATSNPPLALEAGMAALRWLVAGYGYDLTVGDVYEAFERTLAAARAGGVEADARRRIQALVDSGMSGNGVRGILAELLCRR
jgi:hypothetical protein